MSIDILEEILNFWFDGDIKVLYKSKWFVSGSESLQQSIDRTINDKYYDYLEKALLNQLDSWMSVGSRGYLALIIVLDQFSRHIYRFKQIPSNSYIRSDTDSKALQIAQLLIYRIGWENDLSVPQQIFALMPFRHSPTVDRLNDVITRIDSTEAKEMDNIMLINKFRKQTMRKLQHLQDREKAKESDDILERQAFVADESDLQNNPLVKSMIEFLFSRLSNDSPVVISLSGGVDSMVIAKVLVYLRTLGYARISRVIAIHIDYANREESSREASFVEGWCNDLSIEFHKRVINEVTRGITDRAVYERVSRDIRYGFYQEVLLETGCDAVMFGHHIGDVQENVISNVMRGCSPLELSGMTTESRTSGVTVWRPLINHCKEEIFSFAHKYGVPYFKDTTPSWSTRGKLRKQLLPLLADMYGEGFLHNLSKLANQSDQYKQLVYQNIYQPFLNTVRRRRCGLAVQVLAYSNQPLCFWKEMLRELMHSMSMAMIREKAVTSFMERLQRLVASEGTGRRGLVGWLELRKGFHTYMDSAGDLVIYKDGVLSERASMNRSVKSVNHIDDFTTSVIEWDRDFYIKTSDFNDEKRIFRLGSWVITISFVISDLSSPSIFSPHFTKYIQSNDQLNILSSLCLSSPVDLLTGFFHYHIAVDNYMDDRLVVLADKLVSNNMNSVVIPLSLVKTDSRLKLGLPLLVPTTAESSVKRQNTGVNVYLIEYQFDNNSLPFK
eukprot:gene17251-22780_t